MAEKTVVRISQEIESRKPIRDSKGEVQYADVLVYMARTTAQDNPDFKIIWNLASYALYGKLSNKQSEIADALIEKYEKINPGVFHNPETKGEML